MSDENKTRRSVTVDKDLDAAIKATPGFNVSGAVNDYLRLRLIEDRDHDDAVRDLRVRELRAKRAAAAAEREAAQARVEQLDERLDALDAAAATPDLDDDETEAVESFAAMVRAGEFPAENLDPDNPAVENHADEAGLAVGRFVEAVESRLSQDE